MFGSVFRFGIVSYACAYVDACVANFTSSVCLIFCLNACAFSNHVFHLEKLQLIRNYDLQSTYIIASILCVSHFVFAKHKGYVCLITLIIFFDSEKNIRSKETTFKTNVYGIGIPSFCALSEFFLYVVLTKANMQNSKLAYSVCISIYIV